MHVIQTQYADLSAGCQDFSALTGRVDLSADPACRTDLAAGPARMYIHIYILYIYIYYACMLYRHNTPTFRPAARTFQPRQAGSTFRPTLPAKPTLRPTLHGCSDAVPLLQGEILIRCTILTAVEKIESCTCTCKKYVI